MIGESDNLGYGSQKKSLYHFSCQKIRSKITESGQQKQPRQLNGWVIIVVHDDFGGGKRRLAFSNVAIRGSCFPMAVRKFR